ncbi:MAG: hypothetical protein ABI813_02120 [Bacteroidota bacterium]
MEKTGFVYKKERAGLSLRDGIELDETSISILFVLRQEQQSFFAAQNSKLEAATAKISSANNSLQVDHQSPRQQAFWFGMGKWGFALLVTVSMAACFYCYYLSKEEAAAKMPLLLHWYKGYYDVSKSGSKKSMAEFLKQYPPPQ